MQKLTLLDYPEKTACTLFTKGCNFSCPFCHNPELITKNEEPGISEPDVLAFLRSRRKMLDAVCITGGEPLLHSGLADFIHKVKGMGFLVKIDTNGSLPDKLKELADTGDIDYVAMDIKNAPSRYAETIGIPGYNTAPVLQSIDFLLQGKIAYEFRTTVVRDFHAIEDLKEIARLITGAKKYCLQSFENENRALQPGLRAYNHSELQEILEEIKNIIPYVVLRS